MYNFQEHHKPQQKLGLIAEFWREYATNLTILNGSCGSEVASFLTSQHVVMGLFPHWVVFSQPKLGTQKGLSVHDMVDFPIEWETRKLNN